jgi:hypothetical protein
MSGPAPHPPVPGRLLYRCRLWGAMSDRVRVPDILRAIPAIVEVGRTAVDGTDVPARMTDVHVCDGGRLGVADLIGAVEDGTAEQGEPATPTVPVATPDP